MTKHFLKILFVLSVCTLFQQCAQVGQLTGGKRDITPPKLLEATPADKSTGFNSDVITLKFDEFVKLKDLNNQFIVSPKLKTTPDVEVDGKSVVIHLKKEELAPNTTYRLFFGNAVVDTHESNSIPDFDYVLSTGQKIDTLKIKGTITEAFDNKPASGVLIGLYSASQKGDSLVYKESPDYMTKCNDNGEFSFSNLPKQTFKVFGIADKNKNGVYDGESEKIAFIDFDLTLRSDSSIKLKLFQEEPSKNYVKKNRMPYYGFGQILLNKKAKMKLSPLKKEYASNISETFVNKEKDTISFYYKDIQDTLKLVLENFSAQKADTLKLVVPKDNSAKKRLKAIQTNANNLAIDEKIKFSFLNWMDTSRVNLSKIKISSKEDSLVSTVPLRGHWTGITGYELTNTLKEGIDYQIKIDTNTFFDIKGFTNDSAKLNFKTKSHVEFGKVTLKLLFNKKQSYIVQMINGSNLVVKEQSLAFSLSSSNAVSVDFTDVPPDTYFVKIIFDNNENKKWDTGNWLSKKQAEKVIINSKQIKVLADWEIEEEILLKE